MYEIKESQPSPYLLLVAGKKCVYGRTAVRVTGRLQGWQLFNAIKNANLLFTTLRFSQRPRMKRQLAYFIAKVWGKMCAVMVRCTPTA